MEKNEWEDYKEKYLRMPKGSFDSFEDEMKENETIIQLTMERDKLNLKLMELNNQNKVLANACRLALTLSGNPRCDSKDEEDWNKIINQIKQAIKDNN